MEARIKMELKEVDHYISEYARRWTAAKEVWVKLMLWELMIKRSKLQSQINKGI